MGIQSVLARFPSPAWQSQPAGDVEPHGESGEAGCPSFVPGPEGRPQPASGHLAWQGSHSSGHVHPAGRPWPPPRAGRLESFFRRLVETRPVWPDRGHAPAHGLSLPGCPGPAYGGDSCPPSGQLSPCRAALRIPPPAPVARRALCWVPHSPQELPWPPNRHLHKYFPTGTSPYPEGPLVAKGVNMVGGHPASLSRGPGSALCSQAAMHVPYGKWGIRLASHPHASRHPALGQGPRAPTVPGDCAEVPRELWGARHPRSGMLASPGDNFYVARTGVSRSRCR